VDTLPDFDTRGALPAGIHQCTWQAFHARFGGTPQRDALLEGLRLALRDLAAVGCASVFVDGSFITAKAHPNDFDACWDLTGVQLDRVPTVFFDFQDSRRAQKDAYGGEFFPMDWPANTSNDAFIDFFQRDRDGLPKGIVRINPMEVP